MIRESEFRGRACFPRPNIAAAASTGGGVHQSLGCERLGCGAWTAIATAASIAGGHRLIVRKPAQRCSLQKLEMRDRIRKLLEATLSVGNFGAEQVLMMAVERLALQVLVGAVSQSNRRACQYILNPPAKARLFLLCVVQGMIDGFQNGPDARLVGFSIPVG